MASSIKTWPEAMKEFEKICEAHAKGFREELDGFICDCEPFIKNEQKVYLHNALEDLLRTIDSISEEIVEEMDALEERRLSRACGFIVRLSDGDR